MGVSSPRQTAPLPVPGRGKSPSCPKGERVRVRGHSLSPEGERFYPRVRGLYPLMAGSLVLGVFALRLPFMTRTLYAFDSANYALAVRDYYNVAHHRPHPPGYPLYVAFAKLLYLGVGDANRALVLEGVLWSVVAVGCTVGLGRRLFGPPAGLLAGLLLVFT